MTKLTSSERFKRMYEHRQADRVPIHDHPWMGTVKRWKKEGMPDNVDYTDYFDLDKTAGISVDITPKYEEKTIFENDEYIIYTTKWGVTQKSFKQDDSTPEFLDFMIVDPDSWKSAKERMIPTNDRIPWKHLKENYGQWKKDGYWIEAGFWFGFDVTHSWTVGTQRLLIALIEEPEWCIDMFSHYLDMNLALFDMIWEAGYKFDAINWPDDMGYKNSQFFSLEMYRQLLKPVHKKAIDWAHSKGIKARLHSCGQITPFIPDLIDIGLDAINPLEVKAGVDPVALKHKYGNDLVLHGGINAVLWDDPKAMEDEIKRVLPVLKENGGYIFSTDHSIPNNVSLDTFKNIMSLVKELGAY
jgi:uroporphyrinogen decarboxylase